MHCSLHYYQIIENLSLNLSIEEEIELEVEVAERKWWISKNRKYWYKSWFWSQTKISRSLRQEFRQTQIRFINKQLR